MVSSTMSKCFCPTHHPQKITPPLFIKRRSVRRFALTMTFSWIRRATHRSVTYTMRSSRLTTRNSRSPTNSSKLEGWVQSSRSGSIISPNPVIFLSPLLRFSSQVMVVPEEAEMMPRAGADYSMLSTTALFAFSDHKNSKSHHALKVSTFCYRSALVKNVL